MTNKKIIHFSDNYRIDLKGIFILVDDDYYGFKMTDDENNNWVVCHRKHMGYLGKEVGFYIPAPLITLPHLFEVRMRANDKLCHFQYRPKKNNRFINTEPHVFVGLAAMEVTSDAEHIVKPRMPR